MIWFVSLQDFHTGEFKPARQQPFGEAAQKRGGNSFELKTEKEPVFSTNVRDEYVQQKFTSPRFAFIYEGASFWISI